VLSQTAIRGKDGIWTKFPSCEKAPRFCFESGLNRDRKFGRNCRDFRSIRALILFDSNVPDFEAYVFAVVAVFSWCSEARTVCSGSGKNSSNRFAPAVVAERSTDPAGGWSRSALWGGMGTRCDIGIGPVVISDNFLVQCNGSHNVLGFPSQVIVAGQTSVNYVQVLDSHVDIVISNTAITSINPFVCISSSVHVVVDGSNLVESVASGISGVECRTNSNITFSGAIKGHLSAFGGYGAPGIGSGVDSTCGSLTFLNGSYQVSGNSSSGERGAGQEPLFF
jgi:hypothetical protein